MKSLWIGLGVIVALVVAYLLLKRTRLAQTIVSGADALAGADRSGGGAMFNVAPGGWSSKIIAGRADSAPESTPVSPGPVPVGTPGGVSKTQLVGRGFTGARGNQASGVPGAH